jgi:hypothetical protein
MPDVNVLLSSNREEFPPHDRYAKWLEELANGNEPFALSELVMQGFIRLVTNPRVFDPPAPVSEVFAFLEDLLERPNCFPSHAGAQHWSLFRQLCEEKDVRDNLAVHAALAIESGCEWVSADTDFARFAPALRWRYL